MQSWSGNSDGRRKDQNAKRNVDGSSQVHRSHTGTKTLEKEESHCVTLWQNMYALSIP